MSKTQAGVILEHLLNHGSITSWEAVQQYRITRLSAVIYNLKKEGYPIQTDFESNEETHWARYTLIMDERSEANEHL
ncbi:DNA-binding protein [Candidatus Saccharibacteria bacterium]|nr:DNA-binding protein [Candidatus Saccharibacteria bacterium]